MSELWKPVRISIARERRATGAPVNGLAPRITPLMCAEMSGHEVCFGVPGVLKRQTGVSADESGFDLEHGLG